MTDNEITIKSLEEFLAAISNLECSDIVYRGQSNADWEVDSTAYRRLETPDSDDLLEYSKHLIKRARRYRGREFEESIGDLHLLAKLRHYGAATLLIDFTRTAITALWFACQNDKTDGKVFCLDVSETDDFNEISRDDEEDLLHTLKTSGDELKKWEPPLDNRVLKQDSFFIFNAEGKVEDYLFAKIITIDKDSKMEILEQLQKSHNLSDETIFPDFYGFAQSNNFLQPFGPQTAEDIFEVARMHFSRNDYVKVIKLCTKVIRREPGNAGAYYRRGLTRYQLNLYEAALADFDSTLRRDPDFTLAYFYRGNTKFTLKRYEEAIADYDEALKRDPDYISGYINRGYAKFTRTRYEEAIADYDEALKRDGKLFGAYLSRGNAKFNLKRYKEAIADYDEAVKLDDESVEAYSARGRVKRKLGLNAEAKKDFDKAEEIEREQRLLAQDNIEDIPF